MSVTVKNSRTAVLVGEAGIQALADARVAVFGVGGVGGYICEALARAGIGALDIFDRDIVSESNINRQIIALDSTVGRPKVEVMFERIHSINKDCKVCAYNVFYLPENADSYDFSAYTYIADAVDTVSAKLEIVRRAQALNIPVISAMGAGNKLDPTAFEVSDIYKTSVCPLAKIMRKKCKELGIKKLKVVYSREEPIKSTLPPDADSKKVPPGSISFMPSAMGLIMASEIIKDIVTKQ